MPSNGFYRAFQQMTFDLVLDQIFKFYRHHKGALRLYTLYTSLLLPLHVLCNTKQQLVVWSLLSFS